MKVYFISGMGADGRVFKHIRLPEGYEMVSLDWIPALENEPLASYALRLSKKIIPGEQFALVGLSMGGMMAVEIAKHWNQQHPNELLITILISSIPVNRQLPFFFKMSGSLGLYKLVPVGYLKSASILNRFFKPDSKEDKAVLKQVIKDSDPSFLRWAIYAVLHWKNETIPEPLCQIHGSRDRVLPMRLTEPTHIIPGASHLMVMSRAKELNSLIAEALLSAEHNRG